MREWWKKYGEIVAILAGVCMIFGGIAWLVYHLGLGPDPRVGTLGEPRVMADGTRVRTIMWNATEVWAYCPDSAVKTAFGMRDGDRVSFRLDQCYSTLAGGRRE